MRAIRDMIEGVACRALAPLAPPLRRSEFERRGLRSLRETWWTPLQYEPWHAVWRNWRLIESSPEPRSGSASFPEDARIAVYTPGHLGDVLHTAPLMRALRAARPSSKIVWIVGPWCEALAREQAPVDEVRAFSPAWVQYRRGVGGPRRADQEAWGRELPEVDVFISTAATDLTAQFVGRSVRPLWWCGRRPYCELYPVAGRQDLCASERDRYEADDILRIAAPLGIASGEAVLQYRVDSRDAEAARCKLTEAGVAGLAPYVVMAPAAGWPGKQWMPERWAEVADELHLMGFLMVMVGSEGERPLVERVRAEMRSVALSLAGRTSIRELAAVIAGARLWLGSDSGGLHLAAAVGTPTVALFGPTNPAKWAPRGPRHVALRGGGGCPGCHPWHPRAPCVEGGRCMREISVRDVRAAIDQLMSGLPAIHA